jgi:hypothetical protein
MSVGNMPSLSMMELGLGMGTIHEEEHEHHHPHPPPIGIGGTEGKTGTTMERGKTPLEEEGELEGEDNCKRFHFLSFLIFCLFPISNFVTHKKFNMGIG